MPHDHHHHSGRNLTIAFFLNLGFTVLEVIGGLLTNSVAILSDALHDLGDSFSLGLSLYLDRKSKEGANEQYTFGYHRFSLLGAMINSLVLIGVPSTWQRVVVGAIILIGTGLPAIQARRKAQHAAGLSQTQ